MRAMAMMLLAAMLVTATPNKAQAYFDKIDWDKTVIPLFRNMLMCTVGPVAGPSDWARRQAACDELTKLPDAKPAMKPFLASFLQRDKGETALSEKNFKDALGLDKELTLELLTIVAAGVNDRSMNGKVGTYPDSVALRFANLALQVDAGHGPAYREKGHVLQRQLKHAEAVAAYSAALGLTPEDTAAYNGRALSRMALGDQAGAQADLAKAAELASTKQAEAAREYQRQRELEKEKEKE